MNQSNSIGGEYRLVANTLKKIIKSRGITYEELATKLNVSVKTVQRFLNGDDYSLSKVSEVCSVVGIKFFDLMRLSEEEQEENYQLTLEQEEFLAENPRHFRFLRELGKDKSLSKLEKKFSLSKTKSSSYARDLERLGLLERIPNDQVKLKYQGKAHNFISGGPLEKVVALKDATRFVEKSLSKRECYKGFSTSAGVRLSKDTIEALIKESEELSTKYRLIAQREGRLINENELLEVRWMLGVVYPFNSWVDEVDI